MKIIDAGTAGTSTPTPGPGWQELGLPDPWPTVIAALNPGPVPRPVQALALREYRILESRRNLIISSPTSSGKSLVGLLVLLDAVRQGRRAVLLEPLRAIAREKADELTELAPRLGKILGRPLHVRISTGDYRLEDETFAAPPPQHGELIIATPERMDAILRNPDYAPWIASVDAVCVDEAHLISSPRRGLTLEYLLTTLLCLPMPPRITLLSATLGDVTQAQAWLAPCDVVVMKERYPTLQKVVLALDPGEDAHEMTVAWVKEALSNPEACVLIFVYQTRSAEHLANQLCSTLGVRAGTTGPLAYHAQMSAAQRDMVRQAFRSGQSCCLVATTALGLGVNLPATHVLVRDTTFAGIGPLSVADLLQMLGRAGRHECPGYAAALVRPQDTWDAEELAQALRAETMPGLVSSLGNTIERTTPWGRTSELDIPGVATHVAAYLTRCAETGHTVAALQTFFARSLGGTVLAAHVPMALAWLCDPLRVLAYQEDQQYHLTVLGRKATQSVLPLPLAAGVAQLIRDLLTIDPTDRLLERWRPLDHLIVLHLLSDRTPALRSFSAALTEQVDAWMEQHAEQVPLLYRDWIAGQPGASRAGEVLGSLGISLSQRGKTGDEAARKRAYLAAFRSIILYERGQGTPVNDLARRWNVKDFAGIEDRWRDDMLWLLSGLAQILDLRCFYYHLREACHADAERIKHVKHSLRRMVLQTFDVRESLKYCSPLGSLLRSIRRMPHTGNRLSISVQSIRRLEEAGVVCLADLVPLQVDDLVDLGVRRDLARQIRAYVQRRLQ